MVKEKKARAQLVDSVLWICRAVVPGTLHAQRHSSCVTFAIDVKREVDYAVPCHLQMCLRPCHKVIMN